MKMFLSIREVCVCVFASEEPFGLCVHTAYYMNMDYEYLECGIPSCVHTHLHTRSLTHSTLPLLWSTCIEAAHQYNRQTQMFNRIIFQLQAPIRKLNRLTVYCVSFTRFCDTHTHTQFENRSFF